MRAIGNIKTRVSRDLSGEEIKFSFLDSGKVKTNKLGEGGNENVEDKEGNYRWAYKIPEDAKPGKYFLQVEYQKEKELQEFSIVE